MSPNRQTDGLAHRPTTVTLAAHVRRGLINRKANCILCTFKFLDPLIKTYLVKSYCLSLYGCVLWSLSSVSLKSLQIAINKILRKIWHLPRHSHTSIVLCVAKILYIHEIIFKRFTIFFQRCTNSDIPLVNCVFQDSSYFVYTSTGYNHMYGNFHLKQFNDNDLNLLDFIAKFLVIIHLMKLSYLIINFIIIVLFFCVDYCLSPPPPPNIMLSVALVGPGALKP